MKTQIGLVSFSLTLLVGGLGICASAQEAQTKTTVKTEAVTVEASELQPLPGFAISFTVSPSPIAPPVSGDPLTISLAGGLPTGLLPSEIRIENVGDREILRVSFEWSLTGADTTKHIRSGQTEDVKLKGLTKGVAKNVACPLPEFAEMFRPLSKNGFIGGEYTLQIMVAEVTFADGTKWKPKSDKSVSEK